jgi:hypothetical protein
MGGEGGKGRGEAVEETESFSFAMSREVSKVFPTRKL